METRLLGYENAKSVKEITSWANELVGKAAPDLPGYRVVRIIHFQITSNQTSYDAVILVEVMEFDNGIEQQIELRAEDIAMIEKITSAIGEEPPDKTALAE